MKWLTILFGILIIVAGVWLLFSPDSADSPATTQDNTQDMQAMEKNDGGSMNESGMEIAADVVMEDGTLDEPMGDPIFHALVTYTNDGFSPKTITIAKGETVRFVNQADADMWVGGDNHPAHTIYPEKADGDCLGTAFDTCRELLAGEFWEFTFNHVGEWGYHNHVRARDTGSIIVTE